MCFVSPTLPAGYHGRLDIPQPFKDFADELYSPFRQLYLVAILLVVLFRRIVELHPHCHPVNDHADAVRGLLVRHLLFNLRPVLPVVRIVFQMVLPRRIKTA